MTAATDATTDSTTETAGSDTSGSATRPLTFLELSIVVKMHRESRKWSQEQFAEICKLSTRTVQRVEEGQTSTSLDTRRALAIGFGFEDIDAFTKPYTFPSLDELRAQQEKFDKEHMTVQLRPLGGGRELAQLVTSSIMDCSESTVEMAEEASLEFASLVDYYREFRDCADLYSEVDKLAVYADFDAKLKTLQALDITVRYATRTITVPVAGAESWTRQALFVIACKKGEEPDSVIVPKAFNLGV